MSKLETEVLPNGNLKIWMPDEAERDYYARAFEDRTEDSIWADLWEEYSCNGSFTPIDPEIWFVGLTSDPYIIAAEVSNCNNGDLIGFGGHWHYPDYQLRSVVEKLLQGEEVTLTLWKTTDRFGELLQRHRGERYDSQNHNCLEGVRCPRCRNNAEFEIVVRTSATLTDDGTETFGDTEYDDDSLTTCVNCKFTDDFRVFKEENHDDRTDTADEPAGAASSDEARA